MSEHTKGIWNQDKYGRLIDCHGNDIKVNGFALSGSEEAKENTRRILACVNVLEDVPIEHIEFWIENKLSPLSGNLFSSRLKLERRIVELEKKLFEARHKIQEIEELGTYFNAP